MPPRPRPPRRTLPRHRKLTGTRPALRTLTGSPSLRTTPRGLSRHRPALGTPQRNRKQPTPTVHVPQGFGASGCFERRRRTKEPPVSRRFDSNVSSRFDSNPYGRRGRTKEPPVSSCFDSNPYVSQKPSETTSSTPDSFEIQEDDETNAFEIPNVSKATVPAPDPFWTSEADKVWTSPPNLRRPRHNEITATAPGHLSREEARGPRAAMRTLSRARMPRTPRPALGRF